MFFGNGTGFNFHGVRNAQEAFENPGKPLRYLIVSKNCTYEGKSAYGAGYTFAIRNIQENRSLPQFIGPSWPKNGVVFKERPSANSGIMDCKLNTFFLKSSDVHHPKKLEEIGFVPKAGDKGC